ncbi:MAG: hypothetical protein ACR650_09770 [Methylocystis sp.]
MGLKTKRYFLWVSGLCFFLLAIFAARDRVEFLGWTILASIDWNVALVIGVLSGLPARDQE